MNRSYSNVSIGDMQNDQEPFLLPDFDNDDVENKSPNSRIDPSAGNSQSSGDENCDSDSDSSTPGVSSGTKPRLEIQCHRRLPHSKAKKRHFVIEIKYLGPSSSQSPLFTLW
jgi:hypothetical protein